MPTLVIRNIDERIKARLQARAGQHGRSMEEEARQILRAALTQEPKERSLAEEIRRRFAKFGGVELELPPREPIREPPNFPAKQRKPRKR